MVPNNSRYRSFQSKLHCRRTFDEITAIIYLSQFLKHTLNPLFICKIAFGTLEVSQSWTRTHDTKVWRDSAYSPARKELHLLGVRVVSLWMGVSSPCGLNSLQLYLPKSVTTNWDLGWCWSRVNKTTWIIMLLLCALLRAMGNDDLWRNKGTRRAAASVTMIGDRQTDKHYRSGMTDEKFKVVRGSYCSDECCWPLV